MKTLNEAVDQRVLEFITGLRSENTRTLTRKIVKILLDKRKLELDKISSESNEWNGGWVRSRDIFRELSSHNPRAITRLLEELSRQEIIIRMECKEVRGIPGRHPVFYRVPDYYPPFLIASRQELIEEIYDHVERSIEIHLEILAAELIFYDKTGEKLRPLTKEKVKELKENKRKYNEEILKRFEIKEKNPCDSVKIDDDD